MEMLPVLTRLGLACLASNRHGHDILSIRVSRASEGAAFQLMKEGLRTTTTRPAGSPSGDSPARS
jgi:hypothetical protein